VDELKLVLPVGNLWVVVVKIVVVVVVVGEGFAVVKNDPFAAVDVRGTVIANHVENQFDPCCVECVNEVSQGLRAI
jgi:hypothetical protein